MNTYILTVSIVFGTKTNGGLPGKCSPKTVVITYVKIASIGKEIIEPVQ
jgi:hypothetical protein